MITIDISSGGISIATENDRKAYTYPEIYDLTGQVVPVGKESAEWVEVEAILAEQGIDLESDEIQAKIAEQLQAIEDAKPTAEQIQAQKERDAEDEARKIAIEEIIAEKTLAALDKVKTDIADGKVDDVRKAVRDEHAK